MRVSPFRGSQYGLCGICVLAAHASDDLFLNFYSVPGWSAFPF